MTLRGALLTALGFLLLGVGAIGVFLPVLPTTPFVLAASACFSANPRVRDWLHRNPFFHEHITNYKERTGLKRNTLAASLAFLWIALAISMAVIHAVWASLLLTGVGIAVTIHLLCIAKPNRS